MIARSPSIGRLIEALAKPLQIRPSNAGTRLVRRVEPERGHGRDFYRGFNYSELTPALTTT